MAAHYDQAGTAEALEAEGFERKLAAGLARVLRDQVMAKIEAGVGDDAEPVVAAINETARHLDRKIDGVRAEVGAVRGEVVAAETRMNARIDGVARDLSHRIELAARDIVEKAGEKAEAIAERHAARTNMWMGFATVFLGLMIGASALLPAVVALFK